MVMLVFMLFMMAGMRLMLMAATAFMVMMFVMV